MKAFQQKKVQIICIIILACALVTPVLAQTTSLTITASPLNPAAGDAFSVSGFLRDSGSEEGLPGQFVTVELSTNGGASFVPVANLVTVTDGAFEVDQTQTVTGTYLYRATFGGTTQFGPSVSNRVNVTVGAAPGPEPTALTIAASPSNPSAGDTFTVSGFLTDTVTGEGLVGQFVTVEVSANGGSSYSPAANLVTVTDGAFEVDQTQTTAGTYLYRATFAGTTDFASSVSGATAVTVGAAPGPEPTALALAASSSNPAVGEAFTISGFLTDAVTGEGLVEQFVTVEVSVNGSANFTPVASLVTVSDGAFGVNQTQTTAGTYRYRATFAGTTELAASVSNGLNVTVGAAPGPESTALTISASTSDPAVGDTFTVSGFLTDAKTSEGLADQFITVFVSTDGGKNFTLVGNLVTVTDGAFQVDQTQTVAGRYLYAATFEGTTDLAASVSNVLERDRWSGAGTGADGAHNLGLAIESCSRVTRSP